MNRRLTENDKARLLEYCNDAFMSNAVKHLVDLNETKDFNEGFIAGILMAIEVINQSQKINTVSAVALNAVIQEILLGLNQQN